MTQALFALLLLAGLCVSAWGFRYKIRSVLDRAAHAYLLRSSQEYRSMYIAHQLLRQREEVRRQQYIGESKGLLYPTLDDIEATLPSSWPSKRSLDISHHLKYQAEVVEDPELTREP